MRNPFKRNTAKNQNENTRIEELGTANILVRPIGLSHCGVKFHYDSESGSTVTFTSVVENTRLYSSMIDPEDGCIDEEVTHVALATFKEFIKNLFVTGDPLSPKTDLVFPHMYFMEASDQEEFLLLEFMVPWNDLHQLSVKELDLFLAPRLRKLDEEFFQRGTPEDFFLQLATVGYENRYAMNHSDPA